MAATTSFSLASFTLPTGLSLTKPQTPTSLPFISLTKTLTTQFTSLSFTSSPTRFTRNVAVSSEYGQEEGVLSGDDDSDTPVFSEDLKLFVGNLPFTVDSSALAELFSNAGTVEMVEVIYDRLTGRSRGFGFVTMSTAQEAEAAAQQFNGYELDGRQLRVNAGPPPPRDSSGPRMSRGGGGGGGSGFGNGNKVHVSNLSWNTDDSELRTLFAEVGDVAEAKVIYDRDSGRSRGFGFVTYGSADDANSAIESLDGADLNGRSIRVAVAESRPRRQF